MIVTLSEVKSLLRLSDTFITNESIELIGVRTQRLANKNVNQLYSVAGGETSTATEYTTLDYNSTQDFAGYTILNRISTGNISDGSTVYIDYGYNDYDTDISYLIPFVQDDVVEYLNNCFEDKNTSYESCRFEFNNTSPPTIDDPDEQFILQGFESTMDIAIQGTYRNKGIYTIDTLSAGTLTLISSNTLLDESSTDEYGRNCIRISRVNWPDGIKLLTSQIIWENISRGKTKDVKSKSLGPSAITYHSISSGGYSESIMNGLKKYKITRVS